MRLWLILYDDAVFFCVPLFIQIAKQVDFHCNHPFYKQMELSFSMVKFSWFLPDEPLAYCFFYTNVSPSSIQIIHPFLFIFVSRPQLSRWAKLARSVPFLLIRL